MDSLRLDPLILYRLSEKDFESPWRFLRALLPIVLASKLFTNEHLQAKNQFVKQKTQSIRTVFSSWNSRILMILHKQYRCQDVNPIRG
ncbi:unnamed protein product [Cylicocyclus nassatus]|uniref:Uncharacterized protein n=1 Tax=Cylicocyclus nassatus TaxID=53992 RepID=A0AA36DR75_CYLNA|nr:unnamed protein product [Cylicocyclus nassatus]